MLYGQNTSNYKFLTSMNRLIHFFYSFKFKIWFYITKHDLVKLDECNFLLFEWFLMTFLLMKYYVK